MSDCKSDTTDSVTTGVGDTSFAVLFSITSSNVDEVLLSDSKNGTKADIALPFKEEFRYSDIDAMETVEYVITWKSCSRDYCMVHGFYVSRNSEGIVFIRYFRSNG